MRQRIASSISDDETPPPVEDFGLHHPVAYVELVVSILKRSNFTFWPDEGGLNNQSSQLIDDVLTWLALERRTRWEHEQGIDSEEMFDGYDEVQTETLE